MAGSNSVSNESEPNRSDSSTHAETAPGVVTPPQPIVGMLLSPAKRERSNAAGDLPEALSPCSPPPAHTSANASAPIPLLVGSRTVSATAVATAASMALPPRRSMSSPACAASGWLVATQLLARIGVRFDGYGNV